MRRLRCANLVLGLAFTPLGELSGAAQRNAIGGFKPQEFSTAELIVEVEYTYSGEDGTDDVFIAATPEEPGGVFDPRLVDYEERPLLPGQHTVQLKITKVPLERAFTSTGVRVCMSTPSRAILCEVFPRTKSWSDAANPPPPAQPPTQDEPPGPQVVTPVSPSGTCRISGEVTGRLRWDTRDDRGKTVTFELEYIYLRRVGSQQSNRARVHQGRYAFDGVAAGFEYRLFPGNFRATPPERQVSCRANVRRHVSFTITGPPRSE